MVKVIITDGEKTHQYMYSNLFTAYDDIEKFREYRPEYEYIVEDLESPTQHRFRFDFNVD